MKNLKPFSLLLLFVALTSCTLQVESDASSESVTIEKSDITGRWTQTEKSISPEEAQIIAFELKDDFTAEIEIEDASGLQTLSGTWGLGPDHESGAVSYTSDVTLSFFPDSSHKEIRALAFNEVGEKKILSDDKMAFEKN